jgi:hypothetical protein
MNIMDTVEEYLSRLTQYSKDCLCEIAKKETRTGSISILLDQPVIRIEADKVWISHRLRLELKDPDGTWLREPCSIGSVEQYGEHVWTLEWHRFIPALLMREPPITVKSTEDIGTAVLNRLPEFIDELRILHQEWEPLEGMFLAERVRGDKI